MQTWTHRIRLPILAESETGWLRSGRPNPPPQAVKARNILVLADLFGIDVLVETGTYRGDMIAATLDRFKRIYSIEIDPRLARAARRRFRRAADKVTIIEGDSGKLLADIIRDLRGPALFWLDGHYSGPIAGRGDTDTPILAEVDAIASLRRKHGDVVVIDDARLFGRSKAYPPLEDFAEMLASRLGGQVRVADDAIIVLPRPPASKSTR